MMQREPVKEMFRAKALEEVEEWLSRAIEMKGDGSFISLHELRGALSEEYQEVTEALHQRSSYNIGRELKDLAVICLWGLACLKAETLP